MKVELDHLTLSFSPLTGEVFIGILKKGSNNEWKHKRNITGTFLGCVVNKWKGNSEEISGAGKTYKITVKEIKK